MLTLTAETTFFTHGLFTAVRPPRSRLVVNLWHGDGPKRARETHLVQSTVVVAGTALWGGQRPERFGLPPDRVAVVGNPRIDQFHDHPACRRAAGARARSRDRRTVLWLPTYRSASGPHGRTLEHRGEPLEEPRGHRDRRRPERGRPRASLQLVVKPHPLDADSYAGLGIRLLPHQLLSTAGITLYELLGASDAIISDVSSVWPDFLSLDRPVGFYVPDLEELQAGGWLNVPDVPALLPGPRIETPEDAARFIETVTADPDQLRPSRYPALDRIGPARTRTGATDRLLDWLDDFQPSRGRAPLFSSGSPG